MSLPSSSLCPALAASIFAHTDRTSPEKPPRCLTLWRELPCPLGAAPFHSIVSIASIASVGSGYLSCGLRHCSADRASGQWAAGPRLFLHRRTGGRRLVFLPQERPVGSHCGTHSTQELGWPGRAARSDLFSRTCNDLKVQLLPALSLSLCSALLFSALHSTLASLFPIVGWLVDTANALYRFFKLFLPPTSILLHSYTLLYPTLFIFFIFFVFQLFHSTSISS